MKCFECDYSRDDSTDPIVPALAIPRKALEPKPSTTDKTGEVATSSLHNAIEASIHNSGQEGEEANIADERVALPTPSPSELPQCPKCSGGLLRPGVVWFGESLPNATMRNVNRWINFGPIDLMLVIGTSSTVYPAAGYVGLAQSRGAKVAVINMELDSTWERPDWFFRGDAGAIVPEILKGVIGKI